MAGPQPAEGAAHGKARQNRAAVWGVVHLLLLLLVATPAHAAIAVVANAGGVTNNGSATTSSINTTGSSLIIVGISWYGGTNNGPPTVSDSAGNTWTALTTYGVGLPGCSSCTKLYYVASPTTSATHTFTAALASTFPSIRALALSGTATASPADGESGDNQDTGTTCQNDTALTPTQANGIVVTSLAFEASATPSINGGFTISNTNNYTGGQNIGGSLAYLIQTTAAAAQPTWTSASGNKTCAIAAFKVAPAASGPPLGSLGLMGVGR